MKAPQAWGQRLTESHEVVIRNFCEEKLTLSRIVSVMTYMSQIFRTVKERA